MSALPIGIHHGIPFDEYLALPYVSASSLKPLRRSPWAYRYAKDHPSSGDTKSKSLGTAAHSAILEPHKLATEYAVWDGDRRGKDWKDFEAANSSLRILTRPELQAAQAMRDAVRGYRPAQAYLQSGEAEVTLIWADPDTGLTCKGRIDWLTRINGQTVLVDLKTTRDSSPWKFGAQAFQLGYHIQFAHYIAGWRALHGVEPPFVVIAVENQAPFEPAVFRIPEAVLEKGNDDRDALLSLLTECTESNHWPPECREEAHLELPSYAYGKEDNDLADLGLVLDIGA